MTDANVTTGKAKRKHAAAELMEERQCAAQRDLKYAKKKISHASQLTIENTCSATLIDTRMVCYCFPKPEDGKVHARTQTLFAAS